MPWVLAGALAAALPASAQQSLDLRGGFAPDPAAATLTVAGAIAAAGWVRGCPGHVADAPALILRLLDPVGPARLLQSGDGLAGLVAAGPDGIYRCIAADSGGWTVLPLDPGLPGPWAIWPATVVPGVSAEVQVLVTEREDDPAVIAIYATAGSIDPSAEPAFGMIGLPAEGTLAVAIEMTASAPAEVSAGPGCAGWIEPSRPDVLVRVEAGAPSLAIRARADADTAMVVVDPAGALHCNDDSIGSDPALQFVPAAAGDWAVWVGTFSGETGLPAMVEVSATLPESQDAPGVGALDPAAPPAWGRVTLAPGSALSVALSVTTTAAAADVDPSCLGDIEPSRPDAVVALEPGAGRIVLRAEAEADATLLVVTPDGTILCNDDGIGTDPVIDIESAAEGDYAVYIGLWGDHGPADVTLHAATSPEGMGLPAGFDSDGDTGDVGSPFLGRPLASAVDALDVLLEDPALAAALQWQSLEPIGTEGFRLLGVTLSDPTGAQPPISVAEIVVEGLDLEGMTATGAPGRFRIAANGIDYASLAAAAGASGAAALPDLPGSPPLSLEVGLLPPDGDLLRRDLTLGLHFEGQIGGVFSARLRWPEGPGMPDDADALPADSLALELTNEGYLALALAGQAAAMGIQTADLVAMILDGLSEALAPVKPGSPAARLLDVVNRALADAEGPGRLVLRVGTDSPVGLEALLEVLGEKGGAAAEAQGLKIELRYDSLR